MERDEKLEQLDRLIHSIIEEWYERVKPHYVTEEESLQLGVGPEVKAFHEPRWHRIKFSREKELDVTYGLGVVQEGDRLYIESSVNNKSDGFDFDAFVDRLSSYYWRSRTEKPWTHPDFDRFTYGDIMPFEPRVGETVHLETRTEKADVIRLRFPVNPRYEPLLMSNKEILRDLLENYCLHPLKRLYAESYREN